MCVPNHRRRLHLDRYQLVCLVLTLVSAATSSEAEEETLQRQKMAFFHQRQHRRSDIDEALPDPDIWTSSRQGRLFSNPFGILGHDSCHTSIDNNNVTGVCYNEVECVVRGGVLSGYCGPPAVKGVCCVFATSDCDKRIREKTFYFRNKSFPRNDLVPFQCQLKIKPLKDVCWIRLDYLDFELTSDGSGGTCVYDSMGLMDSPDGPGGRICGFKSGYATVTRAPKGKDLGLSVVVQGAIL